jgi:hypothetical protein
VDAFENIQLKGEECTKWFNSSLYKIGPGLEIPIIFHMVALNASSAIPSVFNLLMFGQGHTNLQIHIMPALRQPRNEKKVKTFEHRSLYKFILLSPRTYDPVDVFELHL